MEQRRLRLGDILDDYCPRERRVTNHAVVAMIEEDVKQTRCTTCDAEHAYKGGKAPRKRKKETASALYKEVLAGVSEDALPNLTEPSDPIEADSTSPSSEHFSQDETPEEPVVMSDADPDPIEQLPPAEEGPVHRPLIRATLPRPEGQKDTRPVPEFTVRHSGNRPGNGNYRQAGTRQRGVSGASGGGTRTHGGQRFAGSRGNGRGPGGRVAGGGFRPSQQPRRGGKKRSR
jgi:hypothetical protein